MKTVRFARRWRFRVNGTTVEEYPAGSEVTISAARAKSAEREGVLDGAPIEAGKGTDKPGSSEA